MHAVAVVRLVKDLGVEIVHLVLAEPIYQVTHVSIVFHLVLIAWMLVIAQIVARVFFLFQTLTDVYQLAPLLSRWWVAIVFA